MFTSGLCKLDQITVRGVHTDDKGSERFSVRFKLQVPMPDLGDIDLSDAELLAVEKLREAATAINAVEQGKKPATYKLSVRRPFGSALLTLGDPKVSPGTVAAVTDIHGKPQITVTQGEVTISVVFDALLSEADFIVLSRHKDTKELPARIGALQLKLPAAGNSSP